MNARRGKRAFCQRHMRKYVGGELVSPHQGFKKDDEVADNKVLSKGLGRYRKTEI